MGLNEKKIEVAKIPFNMFEARCYAYEEEIRQQRKDFMAQIDKEKEDKQRTVRHWKQAVIALTLFAILILGSVISATIYILNNYEIMTYAQDSGGINIINSGEQGDVYYGPEGYDTSEQER